jgi:hypothetical protein
MTLMSSKRFGPCRDTLVSIQAFFKETGKTRFKLSETGVNSIEATWIVTANQKPVFRNLWFKENFCKPNTFAISSNRRILAAISGYSERCTERIHARSDARRAFSKAPFLSKNWVSKTKIGFLCSLTKISRSASQFTCMEQLQASFLYVI